jgi:hypothetical protein
VSSNYNPTPYPDINSLLYELLRNVEQVLGSHFRGMYLEGSLANGDFDQASDIDFIVVTDRDIEGDLFLKLQAMHDRIVTLDTPWAIQLEGSYIGQSSLRRYDPDHAMHPNIERGVGERLKMAHHDASWVTHRWILRERGITLAGPPPQSLVDPVSPDDLRQAMRSELPARANSIYNGPEQIKGRGYQSYIVLTFCRMLYTLEHGAVVSKLAAATWAQQALARRWQPLIKRALAGRHHPEEAATTKDVKETLKFIGTAKWLAVSWDLIH